MSFVIRKYAQMAYQSECKRFFELSASYVIVPCIEGHHHFYAYKNDENCIYFVYTILSLQVETTTEVTAEFQRLNILLMRAVEKDHQMTGMKVATATLTGAKIEATIGMNFP